MAYHNSSTKCKQKRFVKKTSSLLIQLIKQFICSVHTCADQDSQVTAFYYHLLKVQQINSRIHENFFHPKFKIRVNYQEDDIILN